MSEREARYFTVEQANATLPLVRRVVHDLMALHPQWRAAVAAYEAAQAGVTAAGESEAAIASRVEAGRLAGEIESCMDELEQVGCIFKGFDGGLVDFPSLRDGRLVYLCWRDGERSVSHWHEVDGGFAGRQPLNGALTSHGPA